MGLLPPAPRGPARPEDVPIAEKPPVPNAERAKFLEDADRERLSPVAHAVESIMSFRPSLAAVVKSEAIEADPSPPPEPDSPRPVRHGPCSGVGQPLVRMPGLRLVSCPGCPAVFLRPEGDPTPAHRWEDGELVTGLGAPLAMPGPEKSGVAARADHDARRHGPPCILCEDGDGTLYGCRRQTRPEFDGPVCLAYRPAPTGAVVASEPLGPPKELGPAQFYREPPRAGVGLPPLGDGPVVAQSLPDVPPWPELNQGPPGSCPGVGKPLVRRYEPHSFLFCEECECSWTPDTAVAPAHEPSNNLADQRLRRLDTWAQAAGGLLGQLRRRVLDLLGRDVGEELDRRLVGVEHRLEETRRELRKILGGKEELGLFGKLSGRVQDVESRLAAVLAGQGEFSANLRALENHALERITAAEERLDTIGRCLERFDAWANGVATADSVVELGRRVSDLERAATDTRARPGFIRGHLGKALRHLAALVEDER